MLRNAHSGNPTYVLFIESTEHGSVDFSVTFCLSRSKPGTRVNEAVYIPATKHEE